MATKLIRVVLTGTGQYKEYGSYRFYLCNADVPFPKLKRRNGLFVFVEQVEFSFKDMPQIPKLFDGKEQDSFNYRWFDCKLEITDPEGKLIRAHYAGTYNKIKKEYTFQTVNFSADL